MGEDDRLLALLDRLESTLQEIRAELRERRAEARPAEEKTVRAFADEAFRARDA